MELSLGHALETLSLLNLSAVTLILFLILILTLSAYVRIGTALSVLRLGFGFSSLPSALITGGFSLILAVFVMYPTLSGSLAAVDKSLGGKIAASEGAKAEAIDAGLGVWKQFLLKLTPEAERAHFVELSKKISNVDSAPTDLNVLAPAFLTAELRRAFSIALRLLVPFLVIDLLVGAALNAVSLSQVQPAILSFAFKLVLFVLVDGWGLITDGLINSFL